MMTRTWGFSSLGAVAGTMVAAYQQHSLGYLLVAEGLLVFAFVMFHLALGEVKLALPPHRVMVARLYFFGAAVGVAAVFVLIMASWTWLALWMVK